RAPASLADPHLAEREAELVGERAFHVLGDLGDRAVEAHARLDAHGQQVECIGEVGLDPLAATTRLERDEVVGGEEARGGGGGGGETPPRPARGDQPPWGGRSRRGRRSPRRRARL